MTTVLAPVPTHIPTLSELPDDPQEIISMIHQACAIENMSALMVGRLLIKYRSQVEHGDWTDFVEKNLPFSVEHASRYIRLAQPEMVFLNKLLENNVIHVKKALTLLRVQPRGSTLRKGKYKKDDHKAQDKAIKQFWESTHTVYTHGLPTPKKFSEMSHPEIEEAIRVWNSDETTIEAHNAGIPIQATRLLNDLPKPDRIKATKVLSDAVASVSAEPISTAAIIVEAFQSSHSPTAKNKILEGIRNGDVTSENLSTALSIANKTRGGAVISGDNTNAAALETSQLLEELIKHLNMQLDNIQRNRQLPAGVRSLEPKTAIKQIVNSYLDLK